MNHVERVIEKFGGVRQMAAKLSTPDDRVWPNSVQHWLKTKRIPASRQKQILETARREGISLKPAELVDAA